MRVVVIGFMGSGKSTVSALLAENLKLPLYEFDELVPQRVGLSSVKEIFEQFGEQYFREQEHLVCHQLTSCSGVMSCGGGVVEREDNIPLLRSKDSLVVYLMAEFGTIERRIEGCSNRPLFQDRVAAHVLYERRKPLYRHYSDFVVETDALSPTEVRDVILRRVLQWQDERHEHSKYERC